MPPLRNPRLAFSFIPRKATLRQIGRVKFINNFDDPFKESSGGTFVHRLTE